MRTTGRFGFLIVLLCLLSLQLQAQNGLSERKMQRNAKIMALAGLKVQKKQSRKIKKIPIGSNVTVLFNDEEVKGTLLGVGEDAIELEFGTIKFIDIKSIGYKNSWTVAKGVGIVVLGTTMVVGGVVYAIVTAPLFGALAGVTGVGVVSMAPSVFRFGKRYHFDGEWVIVPDQ